jgi:hypothetical protein
MLELDTVLEDPATVSSFWLLDSVLSEGKPYVSS